MARNLGEVKIDDVRIRVVELTGPQTEIVIETIEKGYAPGHLDKMMGAMHIPEFALDMMTAPDRLSDLIGENDWAPSEYAPVYEKAQEMNPHLYQALQNFREKGSKLQGISELIGMLGGLGGSPSNSLTEALSTQKDTDIPT